MGVRALASDRNCLGLDSFGFCQSFLKIGVTRSFFSNSFGFPLLFVKFDSLLSFWFRCWVSVVIFELQLVFWFFSLGLFFFKRLLKRAMVFPISFRLHHPFYVTLTCF